MGKEQSERIRLNDYVERLLAGREEEDIPASEDSEILRVELPSPTSAVSKEETRLFMSYQEHGNLFNIAKHRKDESKALKLRKFFKMKRHQQVEVHSFGDEGQMLTEGKVGAIGRDFVMLTNLKERVWIPYTFIETANIPYGIPQYSNTHQNFFYDNDLRNRLLQRFGETVANRDILRQQFFEETFLSNLLSWEGTWVEVHLKDGEKRIGKIAAEEGRLTVQYFKEQIEREKITHVRTVRWLALLRSLFQRIST